VKAGILAAFAAGVAIAAEPIELPGIHNAFQVTPRVLSGSQPEGEAAFAALAKLGVKTIVSVDGGKPDLPAAKKHGLRYIHLPIGYDSVPAARIPQLAAAASTGDGKIFVHCHHGKHRGPAAVAVICEATAGWSAESAEQWMRKAGTSDDYAGLYRSVKNFQPLTPEDLAKAGPLPEIARTPDVVDAMVKIDERFESLKAAQKYGWNPDAAADAALLWEHLRELARNDDTKGRPQDYRTKLSEGEKLAAALRDSLKPVVQDKANDAMKAVQKNCTDCHKAYRN
jgi:protein tyrosine phosphatase (PTP) superfamily phosphohydrolase (DUF442 family)